MQENETVFSLGRVLATPGVLDAVSRKEIFAAIERHKRGDWGDVSEGDQKANNRALKNGEQVLSSYKSSDGIKFWIVTEGDRLHTTVMLPMEY